MLSSYVYYLVITLKRLRTNLLSRNNKLNNEIYDEIGCNPIFTLLKVQNLANKAEIRIVTRRNSRDVGFYRNMEHPRANIRESPKIV